ncbi:MAG: class I SAM-dependent DNA methyltransferase, partial [Anaerolineales bacterium]|nr:class I SAM-dependent DNA methyltransferase [Anaerolineales bacterium]
MDDRQLERFAGDARCLLIEQVRARLAAVTLGDNGQLRESPEAVETVRRRAASEAGREALVNEVAYTWFNRLCALRYIDVNHYTELGLVSPRAGFTQPQLLHEAMAGYIPEWLPVDRGRVAALLNGQLSSQDPQGEAYRLLLCAACRGLHRQLPLMFEALSDYTELLMPADLLSERSVLEMVRQALTHEGCRDVEVIGWLYQYYIAEQKRAIMARKGAVPSEDVPARTQLFTPHWIVRYLVENSLGRLWLLNHPESRLAERMPYYIAPEEPEDDFLRVNSPEELRVCDPACGSGHLLTYAFDLLYAIYEEQGYEAARIPQLILEKNLWGIEIDARAGQLAAFALTIKAHQRDRRYLQRVAEADGEERERLAPNVCVLEDVAFTPQEIHEYGERLGRDLFTQAVP